MRRNALLSVYNKSGIVEFARDLNRLGFDLIASGGTHKVLTEAGLFAINTADLVGQSILGHKVVTLSRELHAGLLGDLITELEELEALGIPPIHLICVDTYPLEAAVADPDATMASVKEKTDIGGPAMLRSGAKGDRIVICEFEDRQRVIDWLKDDSPNNDAFINELAAKAEGYVAKYCLRSAEFRSGGQITGLIGRQVQECPYGENAWQTPAGLYSTGSGDPLALDKFELIEGKPVSYNNWVDIDRLLQSLSHIVAVFHQAVPYIAIGVKHGNACGAGIGTNPLVAILKMALGSPRALFGGLIMTNFELNDFLATGLRQYGLTDGRVLILDGVIAPSFTNAARSILQRPHGACRMIANPVLAGHGAKLDSSPRLRMVRSGFLEQPNYTYVLDLNDPEMETTARLNLQQELDMRLAWAINATSNSNTITLVKDCQLIGNGVGQQDRVGACELAIKRARDSGHDVTGSVACSDSFFPFPDGPLVLADAGVAGVLATRGSKRDDEVREACIKAGMALYTLPDAKSRGFYGH